MTPAVRSLLLFKIKSTELHWFFDLPEYKDPHQITLSHAHEFDDVLELSAMKKFDAIIVEGLPSLADTQASLALLQKISGKLPVIVIGQNTSQEYVDALFRGGAAAVLSQDELSTALFLQVVQAMKYATQKLVAQEALAETISSGIDSLHNIIRENVDAIVIVNEEGYVQFVNPAAEALLDRTHAELIGTMFGFPIVAGKTTELNIINQSLGMRIAEMRVTPLQWKGKPAHLACLRDITQRKEDQNNRSYAAILEHIRQLSGAIAHEFAQPLQVISHSLAVIEMEGGADSRTNRIQRMTDRISDLVRYLRNITAVRKRDYLNDSILDLQRSATLPGQDGQGTLITSHSHGRENKMERESAISSLLNDTLKENKSVVILDDEYKVVYMNLGAERMLKTTLAELLGKEFGMPTGLEQETEINLVRGTGDLFRAHVRTRETAWKDEPAIILELTAVEQTGTAVATDTGSGNRALLN